MMGTAPGDVRGWSTMSAKRGLVIDKELLDAVKRGRRFGDLIGELPIKTQLDFARRSGASFPKGSPNQAREAASARPKILTAISRVPERGSDLIAAWAGAKYPTIDEWPDSVTADDWREALVARLVASASPFEPPVVLVHVADATVASGKPEGLPAASARSWSNWLCLVSAQRYWETTTRGCEIVHEYLNSDVKAEKDSFLPAQVATYAECLCELSDAVRADVWRAISAARRLGYDETDCGPSPEEFPRDVLRTINAEWKNGFEGWLARKAEELRNTAHLFSYSRFLHIAERIVPPLPPRDASIIADQERKLQALLDMGDVAALEDSVPLLLAFGRWVLDAQRPDERGQELIEVELAGRTNAMLAHGAFTLPALVPDACAGGNSGEESSAGDAGPLKGGQASADAGVSRGAEHVDASQNDTAPLSSDREASDLAGVPVQDGAVAQANGRSEAGEGNVSEGNAQAATPDESSEEKQEPTRSREGEDTDVPQARTEDENQVAGEKPFAGSGALQQAVEDPSSAPDAPNEAPDGKQPALPQEDQRQAPCIPAGAQGEAPSALLLSGSRPAADDVEGEKGEASPSALLMEFLKRRDLEAAYWAASALGASSPISLDIVATLQLGARLQPGDGHAETELLRLFGELSLSETPLRAQDALLLGAACVRPALLAPHTFPVLVLRAVSEVQTPVAQFPEFARILADFAEKGTALSESALSGVRSREELDSLRKDILGETKSWLESAPHRSATIAAASHLWAHLTSPGGALRKFIEDARDGKMSPPDARAEIAAWRDLAEFERRLDNADEVAGQSSKGMKVRWKIQRTLHRRACEAASLVERLVAVQEQAARLTRPVPPPEAQVLQRLRPLAESVAGAAERVVGENAAVCVACGVLRGVAREVASGFKQDPLLPAWPNAMALRESFLTRLPELDTETAESAPEEVLNALYRYRAHPLNEAEIVRQHASRGRIATALLMVERVRDAAEAERVRQEVAESEAEWKRRSERELSSMRNRVQREVLQGAIDDTFRAACESQLEYLERQLDEHGDTPRDIAIAVTQLAAQLEQASQARQESLERRVRQEEDAARRRGQPLPEELSQRIAELLQSKSFAVVDDLLASVRTAVDSGRVAIDEFLTAPQAGDHCAEFFGAVPSCHPLCGDFYRMLRALAAPSPGPSGVGGVREDLRASAERAVHAWWDLQLRHDHTPAMAPMFTLLRWLGFQVEETAKPDTVSRHGIPDFTTHIQVRATIDSPVPRFGTLARGAHQVVLIWGQLEAGQLTQWLAINPKITKDMPVTVLYFHRLDAAARRRFVHALRQQRYTALIIDPCLLLWLCQFEAPARTKAMFDVALAGSVDNPYMPEAAGSIPPEMFFGRETDVDRLWAIDGPCIVYGGRQLGKSALLQQVTRKYHAPESDRFVLYDGAKHTTDLWELFKTLLVRNALLPKRVSATARVKSAIADMLKENPSRRVVVLLDECDQLLNADAKNGFEQISGVRDLMTETGRRFKVVFTGLHSVQRFQRIPNQPLAHFGDPLCIGPLSSCAGMRLILEPLATLGYRFASPELAQRILALTNCHPSLIQLFCRELVGKMAERQVGPTTETPPFEIGEEQIAQIYRSVDLGRKMRERFDWTVDLDPRYRFLGYAFALFEHEGYIGDGGGMGVGETLAWAKSFWPQAFDHPGTNEDELTGLLDEMVGLGIFVGSPSIGYRLRSPNVLRLIGGHDDIGRELDRFKGEPFAPEPEPSVVRRILPPGRNPASVLTLEQETRLCQRQRGVDIVIGSPALGIEEVEVALRNACDARPGEVSLRTLALEANGGDACRTIEKIVEEEVTPAVHIVVSRGTQAPDEYCATVSEFATWLSRERDHEERYVRLTCLFASDEALALQRARRRHGNRPLGPTAIHHLRRWKEIGLRQWFDDADVPPPPDLRPATLIRRTGGWPVLLHPVLADIREHKPVTLPEREVGLLSLAGLDMRSETGAVFQLMCDLAPAESRGELVRLFHKDLGMSAEECDDVVQHLLDLDILVDHARGGVDVEPLLREWAKGGSAGAAPREA